MSKKPIQPSGGNESDPPAKPDGSRSLGSKPAGADSPTKKRGGSESDGPPKTGGRSAGDKKGKSTIRDGSQPDPPVKPDGSRSVARSGSESEPPVKDGRGI